jgi:hypothetical protein
MGRRKPRLLSDWLFPTLLLRLLLLWLFYGVYATVGGLQHGRFPWHRLGNIVFLGIGTPLLVMGMGWRRHTLVRLGQAGVLVDAEVERIVTPGRAGTATVSVRYCVGNQTFRTTLAVAQAAGLQARKTQRITLVVDPCCPRRCAEVGLFQDA